VTSRDAHLFLFCNWGSREELLLGGMPKAPKELLMGQSIWLTFFKKRKSCEPTTTHDLINMLIFSARSFLECFQSIRQCPKSEKTKNIRWRNYFLFVVKTCKEILSVVGGVLTMHKIPQGISSLLLLALAWGFFLPLFPMIPGYHTDLLLLFFC
jgi:hypothetical protein